MIPVEASPSQAEWWEARDECDQWAVVIGGPQEGPDVIPCPALVAEGVNCIHVAYQLNEIEVAHLARGGTLWLTTWGGLPVHLLEVSDPAGTPEASTPDVPSQDAGATQ